MDPAAPHTLLLSNVEFQCGLLVQPSWWLFFLILNITPHHTARTYAIKARGLKLSLSLSLSLSLPLLSSLSFFSLFCLETSKANDTVQVERRSPGEERERCKGCRVSY